MGSVVVLPGDLVCGVGVGSAGVGAYSCAEGVRASIAGRVVRDAATNVFRVERDLSAAGGVSALASRVPEVGQRVLARVKRITTLAAHVEILLVEGYPLASTFSGIVSREQVRDGPLDTVRIDESFVPGDLITAVCVSLGDAASFFLTTVPASCGVVAARSAAGAQLAPHGKSEMVTADGDVERRKVASVGVAAALAEALAA
jgi:exosome complex RNA-binding protein Csl4